MGFWYVFDVDLHSSSYPLDDCADVACGPLAGPGLGLA